MIRSRQREKAKPGASRPALADVQRGARTPSTPTPRNGFAPASPRLGLGPVRMPLPARRDGLPEPLKSNMEAMSGLALDDVRVHRNSSAPAKLGALAFAQGADIHLGAGQERHLPHEAWHVVQQKQGRVTATRQIEGVGLNEDQGLERESDAMGVTAAQPGATPPRRPGAEPRSIAASGAIVQRVSASDADADAKISELGAGYVHLKLNVDGNATSWLVGPGPTYRYVVYTTKPAQWRRAKKGPFKLLGAGTLGRMVNSPSSALTLASSWFNLTSKEIGAWIWWESYQNKSYPAAGPVDEPGTNAAIMGRYFIEPPSIPLSASRYALRPDCEWLHMHGHGRGGSNTADNLYAGGHAANSLMLAVESVYDEAAGIAGLNAKATVSWRVDTGYHERAGICAEIAYGVRHDHPNINAALTAEKMGKLPSHLLTYVHFKLASSIGSYSIAIDPTVQGRLDLGEFHQVFDEARSRVLLGQFNWARMIKPVIPIVGAFTLKYIRDYLVGAPVAAPA